MDAKPDPKPGRWILPLILVAMVGFTYVFVNSIADSNGTDAGDGDGGGVDIGGPTSTSMPVIDTTTPDGDGGDGGDLDPETQAYVDLVTGFDTELARISGEFVAANQAFDDDTADYSTTVGTFEGLIGDLETWAGSVAASNAPPGRSDLADPHQAIKDAAGPPLDAARSALDWLESPDPGTAANRQEAVGELEAAAQTFSDSVAAAIGVAGG